jgi:hypothetical protein
MLPHALLSLAVAAGGPHGPGDPPAPGDREMLVDLGFDASVMSELLDREIVSHAPGESTKKELAISVAMLVRAPLETMIAMARSGRLVELDPDVQSVGKLTGGETDAVTMLQVHFDRRDRDEVIRFLDVEPGDELNLSPAEIDRFAALGRRFDSKRARRQPAAADAVAKAYRQVLVTRCRAYQDRGVDGITPYARGDDEDLFAGRELQGMISAEAWLPRRFADLHAMMQVAPAAAPPGIEQDTLLVSRSVESRPTFILAHRTLHATDDVAIVVERQFYVGHSYNVLQTIFGFVPAGESTLVFCASRTSTDQVAGLSRRIAHRVGRGRMRDAIVEHMKRIRAEAERSAG